MLDFNRSATALDHARIGAQTSQTRPLSIQLRQLEVHLGPTPRPLFGIRRLDIPSGARILIHGPSGCGKTTLLHVMAGLLPPTKGDVLVGHQNIYQCTEAERSALRRKDLGIIFQTFNLLDHLSLEENVALACPRGTPRDEIHRALAQVHLQDHRHKLASYVSLGQKQRTAVARVLAAKPRLILADEPTSSLDDINTNAIMDALMDASANATLILVSHDHRVRDRFSTIHHFLELISQ